MTAIRVAVTAEDIAAGAKPGDPSDPNWHETHNRFWAVPVEEAIARLTGEQTSVDGDGDLGNVVTIGQGAWTLVIDLPDEVNRFLDARWNGEGGGEPFVFALEVPAWVVALVADERPYLTLRQAGAMLGVKAATLRQLACRIAADDEDSPQARRLKAVKLGRDWFVDRGAVEAEVAHRLRQLR